MLDGIAVTIVGMLTVFAFLGVLVVAIHLLRVVAARLTPAGLPTAVVAAAVAAAAAAAAAQPARNQERT